ncbi:PREDICTED: LOW QUALITY PROTEIN: protein RKD5, partial [Nelumbo nucifera]|uniref:LOW QUALITY PROTEIN: protein RKD5 n=1 Tax=Nelumbo nucifera TaxID=4432 RepID=A0A1U7Z7Z9_NELNU
HDHGIFWKSSSPALCSLAVLKNILNGELIRSVHVYRSRMATKGVEREFMFSPNCYAEMVAQPLLKLSRRQFSELFQGLVIGLWLCIFAFDTDCPPPLTPIPYILAVSRNSKLTSISTLANDLQEIFQLKHQSENQEPSPFAPKKMCEEKKDNNQSTRPMFNQDLNCLPLPVVSPELTENQQLNQAVPEVLKKKRATTEDIARIALSDIVKYFNLPIAEASRNLKVGVTVLKRKCRELGIPRWPHRKIKSLDTLIHSLQEEAKRQEQENKVAALAVRKRQKMLESEKQGIERKPFMEIQTETKRFRQDVFKRRHRARASLNKSKS